MDWWNKAKQQLERLICRYRTLHHFIRAGEKVMWSLKMGVTLSSGCGRWAQDTCPSIYSTAYIEKAWSHQLYLSDTYCTPNQNVTYMQHLKSKLQKDIGGAVLYITTHITEWKPCLGLGNMSKKKHPVNLDIDISVLFM